MTTIVGVQHEWGCEIVADGMTAVGDDRHFSAPGMEKIVERGPFLLAAAGLGPYTEPFMAFEPPKPRTTDTLMAFMREKFVPEYRAFLLAQTGKELNNEATDTTVFEGLVAVHGKLFMLSDDGSVLVSHDGVYGLGGGSNFALGAVAAGATAMEAVEIAISYHRLSGPPILRMEQAA